MYVDLGIIHDSSYNSHDNYIIVQVPKGLTAKLDFTNVHVKLRLTRLIGKQIAVNMMSQVFRNMYLALLHGMMSVKKQRKK